MAARLHLDWGKCCCIYSYVVEPLFTVPVPDFSNSYEIAELFSLSIQQDHELDLS
jgi:hypothetical protein